MEDKRIRFRKWRTKEEVPIVSSVGVNACKEFADKVFVRIEGNVLSTIGGVAKRIG